MAARTWKQAAGGWLLATGLAVGQAPIGTPLPSGPAQPGAMPATTGVPSQLMPLGPMANTPYTGALPGLQSPPGDPGYVGFPGAGPQDAGAQIGTQNGQVPGVPQAWAMSVWNPAPRFIVRTEALLLMSDFQKSRALARQANVDSAGQFSVADRQIDDKTRYLLTPRLFLEYYSRPDLSWEASGWASIGPHHDRALGNDFPLYLGAFQSGATTLPATVTNAPGDFPLIADVGKVRLDQNLGTVELFGWKHFTPEKGMCSDFSLGLGFRYIFLNERVQVRFEDQLAGSLTPAGQLEVKTINDLYGAQFGARAVLQSPVKWLRSTVEGKFGVLNDYARHKKYVGTAAGLQGYGYDNRSNLAMAVEANYNLEIFISQYVTAYAGFNVLYVDRVERAAEQLNPDLNAFVGSQKQISDVLLFGPKLGLMMVW